MASCQQLRTFEDVSIQRFRRKRFLQPCGKAYKFSKLEFRVEFGAGLVEHSLSRTNTFHLRASNLKANANWRHPGCPLIRRYPNNQKIIEIAEHKQTDREYASQTNEKSELNEMNSADGKGSWRRPVDSLYLSDRKATTVVLNFLIADAAKPEIAKFPPVPKLDRANWSMSISIFSLVRAFSCTTQRLCFLLSD